MLGHRLPTRLVGQKNLERRLADDRLVVPHDERADREEDGTKIRRYGRSTPHRSRQLMEVVFRWEIEDATGAIEEQTAATDEIAHNVSQASVASAEVASNIEGVAEASKQTGAASESLREVSDSLDERARDMKRSVESFLDGVKTR